MWCFVIILNMGSKRSKKGKKGIPRAVFDRLVKELSSDLKDNIMWQPEAIDALKETSENMLESRFERAANLAKMCKLETVRLEHLAHV